MEDPSFLHQWHLNSIDEPSLLPLAAAFGETLQQNSFSNNFDFNPKTSMETSVSVVETPQKQFKPNNWSPNESEQNQTMEMHYDSCTNLMSFVNSNYIGQLGSLKHKEETGCPEIDSMIPSSDMLTSHGSLGNQNFVFKASQDARKIGTIPKLSQPQDHIIAERKRREKLSQRFIALSALVPGLKKVLESPVMVPFDFFLRF